MATVMRIDAREFNATLRRYQRVSESTFPDICNRKALFIAMGAQNKTPKAEWEKARGELGAHLAVVIGKRGKPLKRKVLALNDDYGSLLSIKIIVARLRRAGKKIPSADKLKEKALKMIRARAASVAYLKSGWSQGIRILKRATRGVPAKSDPVARQIGVAKGGAVTAKIGDGNNCQAIIWNQANTKKFTTKHKDALFRYGGKALQDAVNEETTSTKAEIERRMRENAKAAGIKTS
jgi:hypothetical protein